MNQTLESIWNKIISLKLFPIEYNHYITVIYSCAAYLHQFFPLYKEYLILKPTSLFYVPATSLLVFRKKINEGLLYEAYFYFSNWKVKYSRLKWRPKMKSKMASKMTSKIKKWIIINLRIRQFAIAFVNIILWGWT